MRQVYSAANEIEAHLARLFLDEAGIESVIQPAALANVIGEMVASAETLPSLWVRDEDYDAAMTALARFKDWPGPQGATWKCPTCGEEIDPQFTECWQCGASRPQSGG
ncbi:MAG: DUF2007 domain-containing protein [Phycisphaerae bacterium]|nr:DUF2007 domain-containing protein [Phycisphaerae bacterium]MDW8261249.1 DUF2007 domain-containing protein [Phycisphaerales bacterium]